MKLLGTINQGRNSNLNKVREVKQNTRMEKLSADMDPTLRRKDLKIERDKLFAQYVATPSNVKLALKIKAIDDEIAKPVEDSSARQRSTKMK